MKSGKIMLVTLAALFCVFLSACGFSNDETDDPIKNPIPTATAAIDPTVEPTETPAPAKSNTGSAKKPSSGSSTKNNGGSTGSKTDDNKNTPAPTTPTPATPEIVVPENTPTPPRRSSSSNLRVD